MNLKALLPLGVVLVVLLSGCSKGPPSGTLTAQAVTAGNMDGSTSTNAYTAEVDPMSPLPSSACVPDAVPTPTGHCVKPATNITIHFMKDSLPAPDGNGWTIFLANGPNTEHALSAISQGSDGMWNLNWSEAKDDSATYKTVEARMGDFTYATASSANGTQKFELAPGLTGTTVTASYVGKVLTIDVGGLPGKDTTKYTGVLYVKSSSGNSIPSGESFAVVAGKQTYTAKQDLAKFTEFHIHVGTSEIVLYKGTITPGKHK